MRKWRSTLTSFTRIAAKVAEIAEEVLRLGDLHRIDVERPEPLDPAAEQQRHEVLLEADASRALEEEPARQLDGPPSAMASL